MAKDTDKVRKRANGEGSIFEYRGRGRGAISYTDSAGRRRRTVTGRTQADVRRTLARLTADRDRGMTPPERETAAAYLARWLEASRQRIRQSTWRGYESCVRVYIVPRLGRVELGKLTPADVETLTAWMIDSGRSPRTAALTRVVFRRALQDALWDGLVPRNAAGGPLMVVSRYLGHATITVTADRYSGVTPEHGRSTADAMDRALGGVS